MYLLSYSGNWNDEINVDGFVIIDDNLRKTILELLKNYEQTVYINNGGDDEIEYENGLELLDEITIDKITEKEIDSIDKFFGKFNDYGYNLLLNLNKLDEKVDILK